MTFSFLQTIHLVLRGRVLMGPATATLSTAMGCTTAEMALMSSTAVSEADTKGLISKNSFADIWFHWNWFVIVTIWIGMVNSVILFNYSTSSECHSPCRISASANKQAIIICWLLNIKHSMVLCLLMYYYSPLHFLCY